MPAKDDRPTEEVPEERRPGPAEGAPPPEEPAEQATSEDLEEARRECMELMDRLQRTAADYQNFQKRVSKRMDEAVQRAQRDLVLDILPVVDNFDRAMKAAQGESDLEAVRRGVELVRQRLAAALAKHGVEPIQALGRPFDPLDHEAVGDVPSRDHPEGSVAEVLQTGYRMNGETIRPSRVLVSTGPGGQAKE
jgi:molecular chaperone GrpE